MQNMIDNVFPKGIRVTYTDIVKLITADRQIYNRNNAVIWV